MPTSTRDRQALAVVLVYQAFGYPLCLDSVLQKIFMLPAPRRGGRPPGVRSIDLRFAILLDALRTSGASRPAAILRALGRDPVLDSSSYQTLKRRAEYGRLLAPEALRLDLADLLNTCRHPNRSFPPDFLRDLLAAWAPPAR